MRQALLIGLIGLSMGELFADTNHDQKREAQHVPNGYSFVWADHFEGSELNEAHWFVGMRDPDTDDMIAGADGDYLLNKKYAGYVTKEDSFVQNGSLILRNQKRVYSGDSPVGTFEYTSGWDVDASGAFQQRVYGSACEISNWRQSMASNLVGCGRFNLGA